MSNTRHKNFRNFLTERLTAVAVQVCEEVESILEEYYEENKRLRNLVHTVLSPQIRLPRIDTVIGHYTGGTINVKEQQNSQMDLPISEPLLGNPKEEQVEYGINYEAAQNQGLQEADNCITQVCVKSEPEEHVDSNMPPDLELYNVKVVDWDLDNSDTLSANETVHDEYEDGFSLDSDAALYRSEESSSEGQSLQHQRTQNEVKEKSKRTLQKTMLEWPRMRPCKSVFTTPPDHQTFMASLAEAVKDFPDDEKPLITKMGFSADVELVDCAFGKVPKGSPLSYQCPLPSSKDYESIDDAPPRPMLPLSNHMLEPMLALPTLSSKEQEHLNIMQITWEEAHNLEQSTRICREPLEKLRKLRLTSHFREICRIKPGRSNAKQVIVKIRKGRHRGKMSTTDEEMKSEALREYCRTLCVNWYPCGMIVHPNCPWLGALPDGLVYDPNENSNFGLVQIKCVNFQSFIDCSFLGCQDSVLQLKKTHSYYWHIQAEMMIAGVSWCDLVVVSREDLLVQRIYRDKALINILKSKLGDFFFYHYLPSVSLKSHPRCL